MGPIAHNLLKKSRCNGQLVCKGIQELEIELSAYIK